VPLSPPALSQSGKVVIDPDLYDINRVEVLRGPQGTLYGSGSMGVTIKIVTNQPKLGQFEGSAQVTGSYTDGGGGNGSGKMMLNLPIGDQLAVRIDRLTPGRAVSGSLRGLRYPGIDRRSCAYLRSDSDRQTGIRRSHQRHGLLGPAGNSDAGCRRVHLYDARADCARDNPGSGALAPNGIYFASLNPYNIKQGAVFADGSYKFLNAWTFSTGVRWYSYDSTIDESEWGSATASETQPASPAVTKASARGFNGSPSTFGPDSVWNYEVGEKSRLLDNRVAVNADFYYIKWNGVQQSVPLACGFVYNTNSGNGRSYGPELEISAKLTDALIASVNGTITSAEITHPTAVYAAALVGTNGQPYCPASGSCSVPILNVPRQTAGGSLAYSTIVAGDYHVTARGSVTYTGWSTDEAYYFGIHLPGYALAAARVTVARDSWSATVFGDNLLNKVALTTANNTQFQFNIPQLTRYTTNQPRTIGVQVNYNF